MGYNETNKTKDALITKRCIPEQKSFDVTVESGLTIDEKKLIADLVKDLEEDKVDGGIVINLNIIRITDLNGNFYDCHDNKNSNIY